MDACSYRAVLGDIIARALACDLLSFYYCVKLRAVIGYYRCTKFNRMANHHRARYVAKYGLKSVIELRNISDFFVLSFPLSYVDEI